MKITIEPTGQMVELVGGAQGEVWHGIDEEDAPVFAIVVSSGYRPEHQAVVAPEPTVGPSSDLPDALPSPA